MHYVFYVTDQQLELFGFQKRNRNATSHNSISLSKLDDYLTSIDLGADIKLVFDVADEDLQVESLPVLLAWEKRSLHKHLENKSRQKGADFQRFIWTGLKHLNEDGRKSEIVISAHLHLTKPLTLFLSHLKQNNVLISGLYSSVFLLQAFLNTYVKRLFKLDKTQQNSPLLLIIRMTAYQYRQCFFLHNQLHLTRTVEIDQGLTDEALILSFLAQETLLATRFIYNQNLIEQGIPINYVIFDHADEHTLHQYRSTFLSTGLLANESVKHGFFHVAKLSGDTCSTLTSPYFGAQLLAEFMNRRLWLPSFYRDGFVNNVNRFRYLGFGCKLASVVIAVWLVLVMFDSSFERNSILQSQQDYVFVEQTYQQQKQDLIHLLKGQVLSADIEATVGFKNQLSALESVQLDGLDLAWLTEIIASHPSIKVESLRWEIAETIDERRFNVGLQGVVFPFEGQYEPIRLAIQNFEKSIASYPQVRELKITQKPFNHDVSQPLNITLRESRALPFTLKFSMQMPDFIQREGL